LLQSQTNDLKKSKYPKIWEDLRMKISFGMGAPARVPWIAFVTPEMEVSYGFYPVYLYYKVQKVLVLAYGVSETEEYAEEWPIEVIKNSDTIESFFDTVIPRYGDSYVFKAYKVHIEDGDVVLTNTKTSEKVSDIDLDSDLDSILKYYKQAASKKIQTENSPVRQGLFYMEKQLEDFIIHNWANTELGNSFDLIVEDGELMSQQFRTDIGPIDILAKDKKTGSHVVIELKRSQTSDDTIGQLARYMGWVTLNKKDKDVKGIIIAGAYDEKLAYALKMIPNIEVFLYDVSFNLKSFGGPEIK
jgi:hypothetical protein